MRFKIKTGKVWLVGAGPGSPELLTVKAMRLIQTADVILFDKLISKEILDLIPASALKISVGKQARFLTVTQESINALLIKYAKLGKNVVRLKAGDPFIFGRGGEESKALQETNIEYEVVPGITAAIGAAASADLPLTHRDFCQGVSFITGHKNTQWDKYIDLNHTLVIYMGMLQLDTIQSGLIAGGISPLTPVAIVANATRPNQVNWFGFVHNLTEAVKVTPAVIIVGDIVTNSKFNYCELNIPESSNRIKISS